MVFRGRNLKIVSRISPQTEFTYRAARSPTHQFLVNSCPSATIRMLPSASSTMASTPSSRITRSPVRGRWHAPEASPVSGHDPAITSAIFPGTRTPSLSPA